MPSSVPPASTPSTSSLQPPVTNLPRRVSFGDTPVPERLGNSRTSPKTTSPKTSELRRTLYDYSASKSRANFTPEQPVPAEKTKSMSDLDKEQEARMAKSHKEKEMKGLAGVMNWLERKIVGGEARKM